MAARARRGGRRCHPGRCTRRVWQRSRGARRRLASARLPGTMSAGSRPWRRTVASGPRSRDRACISSGLSLARQLRRIGAQVNAPSSETGSRLNHANRPVRGVRESARPWIRRAGSSKSDGHRRRHPTGALPFWHWNAIQEVRSGDPGRHRTPDLQTFGTRERPWGASGPKAGKTLVGIRPNCSPRPSRFQARPSAITRAS